MPDAVTSSVATHRDYQRCEEICRQYAKTYYFAAQRFPTPKRLATYALYGFVRVSDEIVDNPRVRDLRDVRTRLQGWERDWQRAYETGASDDPVLRAMRETVVAYDIPYSLTSDFLEAMALDTRKRRYATYDELRGYMRGSAVAVGLMMCRIIGVSCDDAYGPAGDLGEAFQLTNFLRDVQEDYRLRDRLYLPLEELARFGVSEADIAADRCTPEFRAFLRFQVERARALYRSAETGIPLLHPDGQLAVRVALRLYEAILDKIEQANYDVFAGRVSTNLFEKLLAYGQLKYG
ncbi:MAG TPA: phytoene/squalene synthase family protein [Armatimonadaceae bacterium]|nr:phytoene/squalene synthase family protein [Armatimonadaceae bacterium]